MKVAEILNEKWEVEYKVPASKKGKFKGRTKASLKKELARLKKSGPHKKGSAEYTKEKELMFALRAKNKKKKFGKVKEAWDEEAHINPEKRGMWDGWTLPELEAKLKEVKASGPHHEGSPESTLEHELEFAIRAKSGWGKVQESKNWGVKHTGENTNKSIAKLRQELANAKKRGDTKEVRAKQFAIRAKQKGKKKWGKVKK